MTHFPGFKDRAQFENGFDELLNRITGQISPQLTYTSAFKTWTSGRDLDGRHGSGAGPRGPGLGARHWVCVAGADCAPSGALIAAAEGPRRGRESGWPPRWPGRGLASRHRSTPAPTLYESSRGLAATGLRLHRSSSSSPARSTPSRPAWTLRSTVRWRRTPDTGQSMSVLRRDSVARFYIDSGAIIRQMLAAAARVASCGLRPGGPIPDRHLGLGRRLCARRVGPYRR